MSATDDLIRQLILAVRIAERKYGPIYEGGHRERQLIEQYGPKFAAVLPDDGRETKLAEAARLMAESGGHSEGCSMVSEGWDQCNYCEGRDMYFEETR